MAGSRGVPMTLVTCTLGLPVSGIDFSFLLYVDNIFLLVPFYGLPLYRYTTGCIL
jgi:hypothetical protein